MEAVQAAEDQPWTQIPLLALVLECADCHTVWEPNGTPDYSTDLRCAGCGGRAWTGEIQEPTHQGGAR